MNTRTNTTLDDLAGEIGFTATVTLATWYGGRNLYVAAAMKEDSHVVRLIGVPAARRLTAAWGGTQIAVPTMAVYEKGMRKRLIGALIGRGVGMKDIARDMGVSERRVQQIRRALEDAGLLPLVLGSAGEKP